MGATIAVHHRGHRVSPSLPLRALYGSKKASGIQALCLIAVPLHLPAQIADAGFVDGTRRGGEVRCDVMLESVLAYVVQQLLQLRNLHYADSAEGIQRIAREFSLADVA